MMGFVCRDRSAGVRYPRVVCKADCELPNAMSWLEFGDFVILLVNVWSDGCSRLILNGLVHLVLIRVREAVLRECPAVLI